MVDRRARLEGAGHPANEQPHQHDANHDGQVQQRAQLKSAGAAEPYRFVFGQAPTGPRGTDEQAHRRNQSQQQQMSQVMARMRLFLLADVRPGEFRVREQFDERCRHDDLLIGTASLCMRPLWV
ncbi:hypothetical protein D3C84_842960 [compost metagenome]